MTDKIVANVEQRLAKRKRNRADYQRSKAAQEAVLLRLGAGEKRIFDQAASNAGLSRSAFAQLYLVPIAAALTKERLQALTWLTASRTASLSTVLATLIDSEINHPKADARASDASANVSTAFDDLFAVNREPDSRNELPATP